MRELQRQIESLYAMGADAAAFPGASDVFSQFRDALTAGTIRAAEKIDGRWRTNEWVKQGILLGFRIGKLAESGDPHVLSFVDKDTYPIRHFTASDSGARGSRRLIRPRGSLRSALCHLHAADVHQCRRLCR